MKYIRTFENKSMLPEDVVKRYSTIYPEYKEFFVNFSERYQEVSHFKEELYDYIDYDGNFLDWMDNGSYTSQNAVIMLEDNVGKCPYNIWVDFKKDIFDSWELRNTIKNYNL